MKFLIGASSQTESVTTRKAGPLKSLSRWAVVTSVLALLAAPLALAKPGISSDGAAPRGTTSENREDLEDIQVKVLGGSVRMTRRWTPDGWEWNSRWNPIQTYSELRESQGETVPVSGNCKQPYEHYLFRNGMSYRPEKFATDSSNCIKPEGNTYQALLVQTVTKSVKTVNGEPTPHYVWRDRSGNVIRYIGGAISEYEDKNGVRVSFTYEQDRIKTVQDHHGNTVITYHWEELQTEINGEIETSYRLKTLEDYSGRKVTYEYGEDSSDTLNYRQLVSVTDVRGKVWTYQYKLLSSQQRTLKSVTDPNNRVTTYSTNADGHVNGHTNADGVGMTYSHTVDGDTKTYKTTRTDSSGVITETWYNILNMPVKQTVGGELQYTIEYQYSDNKTAREVAQQYSYTGNTQLGANANAAPIRLISSITTDARGLETKHYYDTFRNITRTENPDTTYTTTEWNTELTLPTKQRDERGVITEYEYDNKGNLIVLTEAVGTADQRITRYTYDAYGQLETQTTGESTAANTALATTSWQYDGYGNVTKVTSPEQEVTEYKDYDVNGYAHTVVDARQKTWTRDFDAVGNLLSDLNPYGQGFKYEYDAAGDLVKVTDASGSSLHITNNASGLPRTVTDDASNLLKLDYDKGNRLATITDAEGSTIGLEYDSQNRLSAIVDGEQNRTKYTYQQNLLSKIEYPTYAEELGYDKRDRIEQSKQKANNLEYLRKYGYDLTSNLNSDTDALENTEKYEYDKLSRLVAIVDPVNGEGKKTKFTYDARDNLLQVEDPEGRLTVYTYDKADRLKTETKHDFIGTSKQRGYNYDANGNLVEVINPQQEKRSYSYDDANRLSKLEVFAQKDNAQPVKVVDYHYNIKAQYTGYTQMPGADTANATADIVHHGETYTYDALNRLESVRVDYYGEGAQAAEIAFSKGYSYSYYGNGLKKTYTNPEGITYTYYYNKNNQLAAVHVPGEGQLAWTNFNWLAPQTLLLPGGNKITLTYDDFLRVKERILEDSAGNDKATAVYEYDLESNIKGIDTEHGAYAFDYDDLYRLTEADYPLGVAANDEQFGYDGVGNRTGYATGEVEGAGGEAAGTEFIPSSSEVLEYNDQNQLTGITGDDPASFQYNDNGHTTQKVQSGVTWDYRYNHEERLIAVDKNTQTVGQYQYNPYGQRIRKQTGSATYFLYNEEGMAAEYDASGNLIKEYHFKPGMPWMTDPLFQRVASGEVYYYQNDHLGTPQRMVDKSGAVVWEARHEAFGRAEILVEVVGNELRFPGQYFDGESEINYNYFRYFDSSTGRYLESDPIGLKGGANFYLYAYGSPMRLIDPVGLSFMDPVFGAIYDATGGWVPDQSTVDFAAGWGDTLSFGLTNQVREIMGTNGLVDKCSTAYSAGEMFGFLNGLAIGGAAGSRAAAKAASGNNWSNFSHSLFPNSFLKKFNNPVAKWLNKRGNRLNGDYVTPQMHTRMDPRAQFGLSRDWLSANPLFSPFRQMINRIPFVPGAAAYGAGSMALNDCECS